MNNMNRIALDDIRILIIEDEQRSADYISKALLLLENKVEEKFKNDNISQYIVQSTVDSKGDNKQASAQEIYNETKQIISNKKIDILLIDLNLGRDTNQGINLIRQYMRDPSTAFIIKYVITTETSFLQEEDEGVLNNTDIEQYTTIYKKPNTQNHESYKNLFNDKKVIQTFPVLVELYRKQKSSIDIEYLIAELETKIIYMLNENQNSTDLIIGNVTRILDTIDSIGSTLDNVNQKTIAIEIMTKCIAKALPKIGTKANAKKLIEEWKNNNDFKDAMGIYFPTDPEKLYSKLNKVINDFSDKATDDVLEFIYTAGKEYLEEEVSIENDDSKIVMISKYSTYVVEKTSDFLLRK